MTVSRVVYVIGFGTVVDRTRYLCWNGSGLGQVIIDMPGGGSRLWAKRNYFAPDVMDSIEVYQRLHDIM